MGSPKDSTKPGDDTEGSVAEALASLQTQLNELKENVLELVARPAGGELVRPLEEAVLASADLFASLRLSCFGSDARETIKRVTDAATVIRKRREPAEGEGNDHA